MSLDKLPEVWRKEFETNIDGAMTAAVTGLTELEKLGELPPDAPTLHDLITVVNDARELARMIFAVPELASMHPRQWCVESDRDLYSRVRKAQRRIHDFHTQVLNLKDGVSKQLQDYGFALNPLYRCLEGDLLFICETTVVKLPESAQQKDKLAEQQGPYAPGCVRIGNRLLIGMGKLQWKLVSALWDSVNHRPSGPCDLIYLTQQVYGKRQHNSRYKLSGLRRDLNTKFMKENFPLSVDSAGDKGNSCFALVIIG